MARDKNHPSTTDPALPGDESGSDDDADRGARYDNSRESRRARRRHRGRRAAQLTVSVLPAMFTLGNLLFGFAAIFLASTDPNRLLPLDWTPLTYAAVCIFAGMAMDGLDGRIARMTRNTSDMGEQLDSMADMVTFGVAPAFLAVKLMAIETPFLYETARGAWAPAMIYFNRFALVAACIYVACAALRLARFNVETQGDGIDDHMYFKGLPSPGAAGTVASLVLVHQHYLAGAQATAETIGAVGRPWTMWVSAIVMVVIMLLVALAMVSRLKYVHVANRYLRGKAAFNSVVKAVIGLLVLMVIGLQQAMALVFCMYAISAPLHWILTVSRRRRAAA